MGIQEALTIVRKPADGIHPETGELLQTDCLFHHPQAVRALYRAIGALEFQEERERTKRFMPSNAGKAWSNQEDDQIGEELNAAGRKRLRARAYGRGIWEWNLITTPDFQVTIANNPLTLFAGQTAALDGMIFVLNGYNSGVNLSCTVGGTNPSQICSLLPSLLLPTAVGTAFAPSIPRKSRRAVATRS